MSKSVVIVSPDKHLGGLSSGGLGWTDSGRKEAVGGIAREFYRRVKTALRPARGMDSAETSGMSPLPTARRCDVGLRTARCRTDLRVPWSSSMRSRSSAASGSTATDGVTKQGHASVAIRTLDGDDLSRPHVHRRHLRRRPDGGGGVAYTVGREANAQYGETLNGVQARARGEPSVRFTRSIPTSCRAIRPAACCREFTPARPAKKARRPPRPGLLLSHVPDDRGRPIASPFPSHQVTTRYSTSCWPATCKPAGTDVFRKFDPIPTGRPTRTTTAAFSTDNIGMNYDYPEASYERRREIIREHEAVPERPDVLPGQRPRVPDTDPREDGAVRFGEGRVRRQRPLAASDLRPRSAADGQRLRDDRAPSARPPSHTPNRSAWARTIWTRTTCSVTSIADGHARNEGDVQVNPGGPYPISYRAHRPESGASATTCSYRSASRRRTLPSARSAWNRSSWSSASRRRPPQATRSMATWRSRKSTTNSSAAASVATAKSSICLDRRVGQARPQGNGTS